MVQVRFPTTSPLLLRHINGGRIDGNRAEALGELFLPDDADGPVPAVVISEGLGGLKEGREIAYGRFLSRCGCACLIVDSFATRRAAWLKDDFRALVVTEAMMVADAYSALRYLHDHPAVDARKIHLFGFSYGGMISLLAAYGQLATALAPEGIRFAGHVSYYGCSIPRLENPAATGAPVLMILAERDANVSLERSEAIAADLRANGSTVDLETIPGAYHQWDGNDVEMRHVKYSLRRCAVRVDENNESFDERTGARIGGLLSRALFLARRIDKSGYDILRNEKVMRQTDARLLDFIGCRAAGREQAVEAHVQSTRPEAGCSAEGAGGAEGRGRGAP